MGQPQVGSNPALGKAESWPRRAAADSGLVVAARSSNPPVVGEQHKEPRASDRLAYSDGSGQKAKASVSPCVRFPRMLYVSILL